MFDVVIQGPVNDCLLEVINAYRQPYIKSIIYSGWEDEIIPKLPKDIKIVKSKKPEIPGFGNINFQLQSTRAGLAQATSKLVLKIRSDFVIPSNILKKLESFYNKKQRILTLGVSSKLAFFTWDFMYFGSTNNLRLMYSAPFLNTKGSTTEDYILNKIIITETYLTSFYISNFEPEVKLLLKDIEKFLIIGRDGYKHSLFVTGQTLPKYFWPLPIVDIKWLKRSNNFITTEEIAKTNGEGTVFSPTW